MSFSYSPRNARYKMAATFFAVGRFLGITTVLHLFAFFILMAYKIDGPLEYLDWGVVFLPLWLLQTIFLLMALRYNAPDNQENLDAVPVLYKDVHNARKVSLFFLYILVLAFEIMLVIQLVEIDEYSPYKGVSAHHASNTYQQLQCKWPTSDCDDILRPKELEDVIECVVNIPDSGSYIPTAIPVNVLFIPIYIFLTLVLASLVIPPRFAGYIFLDVFSPIILASYFSSPPSFGLPITDWTSLRITLPAEDDLKPGQEGTFDDKEGTVRGMSVRDSLRNHSDDDDDDKKVTVNIDQTIWDRRDLSDENDLVDISSPPEQDVDNDEDDYDIAGPSGNAKITKEIGAGDHTTEQEDEITIDDTIMH